MAYAATGLTLIAGRRGNSAPRIWSYVSPDPVATVRDADYISDALIRGMRARDIVYVYEVHASTGALEAVQICAVLTVDGDGADLTDGTAITMTNTEA